MKSSIPLTCCVATLALTAAAGDAPKVEVKMEAVVYKEASAFMNRIMLVLQEPESNGRPSECVAGIPDGGPSQENHFMCAGLYSARFTRFININDFAVELEFTEGGLFSSQKKYKSSLDAKGRMVCTGTDHRLCELGRRVRSTQAEIEEQDSDPALVKEPVQLVFEEEK